MVSAHICNRSEQRANTTGRRGVKVTQTEGRLRTVALYLILVAEIGMDLVLDWGELGVGEGEGSGYQGG